MKFFILIISLLAITSVYSLSIRATCEEQLKIVEKCTLTNDSNGNIDSESKKNYCSDDCKKLFTNTKEVLSECVGNMDLENMYDSSTKDSYNKYCSTVEANGARAAVKISGSLFLITLSALLFFI